MKQLLTSLFLFVLFFSSATMAGPGTGHEHGHEHSHGPVSSDEVISRASKKVVQLVGKGKIEPSWSGIKASSAVQKNYSKGPEWVVTFKNSKIKDRKKQTLYLFYSLDGHYIAANYTGT